jgi:hypothetical protein
MQKKAPEIKKEIILVPVRVIINDGTSALVEYSEGSALVRVTIPSKNMIGRKVKDTILDKAIRYGIDWRELNYPVISADEIHRQLRNHGIWTAADAQSKPGQVKAALIQACAPLASTIFEFAKNK